VRLLLVVNSFASSVTARVRVLVEQALAVEHDVTWVETNRRGHATRFARDAATRGLDAVVALGGDGTVNEVANGLAGTETALAVLPGGSTNVFARTIGLPNDPVAAVSIVADALKRGVIDHVGLGAVNGRYFCFHTGVGFDAAVVSTVERHAGLKRWAAHPLFVWAALQTWARRYDRRRPHFRAGDVADAYFTVVLNTNPYTYLGGRPLDLAPAATLERGLVAITFRSLSAWTLLNGLGRAVRGGGVPASSRILVRPDLDQLDVVGEHPFPYQVDGDHLGDTTALHFRHEPEAIALVRP
jgi:diacylglycerol kinase family enzyme